MAAEVQLGAHCVICSAPFVPRDSKQVTCGDTRCREKRRYRLQRAKPAYVAMNRARSARWYAAHHDDADHDAWLKGAPPYASHLPGGACELRLSPADPVPLAKAHYIHGMLTKVDGRPHAANLPAWTLLPWRSGWAVVWHDEEGASRAKSTHSVTLYGRPATLIIGPLARLRTPAVTRRGKHVIRLDAITPVSIRTTPQKQKTLTRLVPTASSLLSTLSLNLAPRLGVTLNPELLKINVLSHRTEAVMIDGGKFGRSFGRSEGADIGVRGWIGHAIIECNAPARWLLECAARGRGLGGRTSIGFGRVMVTDVER